MHSVPIALIFLVDVESDSDDCSICYTFPSRVTAIVEFGAGLRGLLAVSLQENQCG